MSDNRNVTPRRVRNGVRLRSRDGTIPTTALSDRLLNLMRMVFDPEELQEGFHYARLGQTVAIEYHDGEVKARVQGLEPRAHEVRIDIGVFDADHWDRIIEAMAGEALYLVRLLAGEMPEGADVLLESLELSLLPPTAEAISFHCTCHAAKPCLHAATVAHLLADELAANPLVILHLRGMPADALRERLRQLRAMRMRGMASAHVDPIVPELRQEPPPLDACVDDYWRPGAALARLKDLPPPQHAPQALLRRLGPSPLGGQFPLVGLLASIYDTVAEHADRLRDQAEGR